MFFKTMTLRRRGRRRWPFPSLGGRFRIVIAQRTRRQPFREAMNMFYYLLQLNCHMGMSENL